MKLVLASQSPARRRLLKRLGYKFRVKPAHIDEEAVESQITDPRRLVLTLSKLKARAVAAGAPGTVVIGSDQVLVCEGRIFGKPHTEAKAREQLRRFSGRHIYLMTGVCVIGPDGREKAFVHKTDMKFRELSRDEIRAYVRADRPLECAGSFKFESRGVGLFDSVKTDDPTAIEGLPLIRLARILAEVAQARPELP